MIVNSTSGVPLPIACVIALGDSMEALATAWLIKRVSQCADSFCHTGDVFRLVACAAGGSLIASSVGTSAIYLGGLIPKFSYFQHWLTWLLGDMSGIAIVAPAFMTWRNRTSWDKKKKWELAAFAALFSICGIFVFSLHRVPLLFLFLPFLIWLAFRFSQREVAIANIVLAALVIAGTLRNSGPLAGLAFPFALLVLQIFVSVVGIAALSLAVTVDERRQASNELRQIKEQLESRVLQRTSQLDDAIRTLKEDIEAREKIQRALHAKEKQLEEAQRLARLGSWEWDTVRDHLIISDEMARIYGVPPEERNSLNYQKYLRYIPKDECALVDAVVQKAMIEKLPFDYEHHVIRPDGELRNLRCCGYAELDESGKPAVLYGTAHDVTETKALELNLRRAEELYRKLVELSPDAIYLLFGGKIVFANGAGLRLAGVTASSQLIGRDFVDLVSRTDQENVEDVFRRLRRPEQIVPLEAGFERSDGDRIDTELVATHFQSDEEQGYLVVAHDVSERKKAERRIQHLAHHDTLTGLANRVLYKERLAHAITQSHRNGMAAAVLFVDLDRFKAINDTAGHSTGDEVLLECAQRLRRCLRESDTVARAGGDEFLILIEAVSDAAHVPSVAQKILTSMSQPFYVGNKEFSIGASIGVSSYPNDGHDVETLIKHADIAMYRAKAEGRGDFRYYSPSMAAQSMERYAMEAALRHALERHEMELYFQPKIDLQTGHVTGAEALMRWNHPEHGLMLPSRFIPLAEDMGLIADFGLWALEEVCRHCRQWKDLGLQQTRIAINLTYSQFADEDFYEKLVHTLQQNGIQASCLELEITETMLMENAEQLMSTLQKLKRIGVHLSVDDFGTGYSSLAYLKRLPVDSVKVDRSFIRDLPADAEDAAITHAVLALVHSLNRCVVAEGIETREQFEFLVEKGCDLGQGFYFSPALPEEAFLAFLAERRHFAVQAD